MAFANVPRIEPSVAYWAKTIVTAMVLAGIVGCQANDDITRTTEARVVYGKSDQQKADLPSAEKVPTRILGIIAPAEEEGRSLFFKMMGPAEPIGKQAAAFDAFLASLKFNGQNDKPVTWTLPDGWREGPRKAGRIATLLTGPEKDAVEMAISEAGGNLLDNFNRWRGQVGLERVKQDSLEPACREVTTKQGKKVMRVDLTGMAAPGQPMAPFMMKGK